MSTFRVVNNYADGFVDRNGFIRHPGYLYYRIEQLTQKIEEINNEIDNINPDSDSDLNNN